MIVISVFFSALLSRTYVVSLAVEDYEADALMVPRHCKFNHLHDQELCLTHDDWRKRAGKHCRSQDMKLNEYGILLSCGTDMFTGLFIFNS